MKNNGNVLFMVLIAVALFATLSYAVVQSGRGSGDIDPEKRALDIAEMMNHFATVKRAVDRLMLINGCADDAIRLWHAENSLSGNPNHYGDGSNTPCQVFHPDGGNVTYKDPPASVQAAGGTEYAYLTAGVYGVGNDTYNDLVIGTNVSREMCIEYNDKVGIINPGGNPPAKTAYQQDSYQISALDAGYTFPYWHTYSFASGGGGIAWGESHNNENYELVGKLGGCGTFTNTSGTDYYFAFKVLIPK